MELSFFLAKLIGTYLLVVSAIWLFRHHQLESSAKGALKEEGVFVLSGVVFLLLGLAIVIDHSIWEFSWRGLITLIGCFAIYQGVMRLAFPKQCKKIASSMIHHRFYVIPVMVIVGAYLAYMGFFGY